MVPDPTMKLIGWAATRMTEAIVDRITDRVATKMKTRVVAAVRQRAGATLPNRRRGA
ncbi:hypothetical protein SPHINGO391_470084 [Sphingomonas aurantiaca]|uniref:Uncharacterized protein n=1 Tax=Sphingomonas aurantiaca TaxID=185949 RepID=A0A5E7ZTV4_9SPHN|nr:hypothetical protein SPHINGO391_470084 [Sphingomonas aurantiaca]